MNYFRKILMRIIAATRTKVWDDNIHVAFKSKSTLPDRKQINKMCIKANPAMIDKVNIIQKTFHSTILNSVFLEGDCRYSKRKPLKPINAVADINNAETNPDILSMNLIIPINIILKKVRWNLRLNRWA